MMNDKYIISTARNFLYHQRLAVFKWLLHGFSLRFDPALKRDINLGLNDYQPAEIVLENRKRLAQSVAEVEIPLVTARQIHSDRVVLIQDPEEFPDPPEGDAMITAKGGFLLAIQTADCLPILVVDPVKEVVAAIHGGWRGLLNRIVMKTIDRMQQDFATVPADCLAAIGPGIGSCCYQVGEEVVNAFSEKFACADSFFSNFLSKDLSLRGTKALDLAAVTNFQLSESGLLPRNIFNSELCTSCRTDLFFSYRAEAGQTGRLMGVIGIRARLVDP